MTLNEEIDKKRKEIRTDGYAMSIGEWISLYENNELDIHPEFQRFFRWTMKQKTDLIESILLGIPIPPVFVSQRDDGVWDVVDGVQRLSTIYQFVGILKDEDNKEVEPLVLKGTKYLPSLNNKVWDNENTENSFDQQLRLTIKRSKINVSVILKESDDEAKYDLFQRLNTGGTNLSAQEVRNCILVMINKDIYLWMKKLSGNEDFQECISLSDTALSESYDMELALRFIIFSLMDANELTISNIGDVGEFITNEMIKISSSENFNRDKYEGLFKNTFSLLNDTVGDKAFKRFNATKNKFLGGFLLSQYELVSNGIAYNINDNHDFIDIEDKIKSIWSNEGYTSWSGTGITASRRLPRIIPLGRELFS